MNSALWNTGTTDDPHPFDQFWRAASSYIPKAKPTAPTAARRSYPPLGVQSTQIAELPASMRRQSRIGWVPFGGGLTKCPGRTFAKSEIIASFAMLLDQFDIEMLLPPGKRVVADKRFYAIGTLPPKGLIPLGSEEGCPLVYRN